MPLADKKSTQKPPAYNTVKNITIKAFILCVSLILSYIENLLFGGILLPGVKLGLSNLTIVVSLYMFGFPTAIIIGILKSFFSLLLFGRFSGLLYSLTGIIFAVFTMAALKRTNKFSLFGISVSGSITHIAGQLSAASLLLSDTAPLRLFPILGLISIFFGVVLYFPEKLTLHTLRKRDLLESEKS